MERLHRYSARELTATPLPINRTLAPLPRTIRCPKHHCGFVRTSAAPTTRLHANGKALHRAGIVRKHRPPVGTLEGTSNQHQRYTPSTSLFSR